MDLDAIFVAGPQGSGKGTQGKKLAEKLGFLFCSMGSILRDMSAENAVLRDKLSAIDKGTLLPDALINEVVKSWLMSQPQDKGIIFDGVPRRIGQAEFLVPYLKENGKTRMATVFIDLPRGESIKRLTLRAQHETRTDDTPKAIQTRFQYYDEEMKPTLDYLKTKTTFIEIDGMPSIDEVTKDIYAKLGIV